MPPPCRNPLLVLLLALLLTLTCQSNPISLNIKIVIRQAFAFIFADIPLQNLGTHLDLIH